MAEDITRVPPQELEGDEGWQRLTRTPLLRGVEAIRYPGEDDQWQVSVWVAEFVRSDPLEARLRDGMRNALLAVAGVEEVAEEDREVWLVTGSPTGTALVEAAAGVVDGMADDVRAAHPFIDWEEDPPR